MLAVLVKRDTVGMGGQSSSSGKSPDASDEKRSSHDIDHATRRNV
jgi:hypothetical protein